VCRPGSAGKPGRKRALGAARIDLMAPAILKIIGIRTGLTGFPSTPNGQAPARKPYAPERRQTTANAKMNARPRRSRAYIAIMNVSAHSP
jgi:hypothetical protein